jgi:hypothetical protein
MTGYRIDDQGSHFNNVWCPIGPRDGKKEREAALDRRLRGPKTTTGRTHSPTTALLRGEE